MTLLVLHEAEVELSESVLYYESKQPGLGSRFRDDVAAAIKSILQNPELSRLRPKGYRRVNLHIFQHYISYVIRGDIIWVVAIAHGHRRPEFWIERLNK